MWSNSPSWSSHQDVQYPSVMDLMNEDQTKCFFWRGGYWLKTNPVVIFSYLCSWCHNNQQNTDRRHFLWSLCCKCIFQNPKFHHYMYHGCYRGTLSHLDKLKDTEKQSLKMWKQNVYEDFSLKAHMGVQVTQRFGPRPPFTTFKMLLS